ncbi:hypothetical protein [Dankookia sp. P2]|uniref:hypothetical protein n=1 Tax=Dankookia sp. P2 TaxID=3423955 RepID=UPI003D66B4BB
MLAALRARIARLTAAAPGPRATASPLCSAIDQRLPGGGLARAAVHEVLAADPGAAAGFCGLLLARARGTVLWIAAEPDAWPPRPGALRPLARRPGAGAGAAAAGCALGDGGEPALPRHRRRAAGGERADLTAARRLQLAAEAGGAIGLLLRPDGEAEAGATAALTRWRVGARWPARAARMTWVIRAGA